MSKQLELTVQCDTLTNEWMRIQLRLVADRLANGNRHGIMRDEAGIKIGSWKVTEGDRSNA